MVTNRETDYSNPHSFSMLRVALTNSQLMWNNIESPLGRWTKCTSTFASVIWLYKGHKWGVTVSKSCHVTQLEWTLLCHQASESITVVIWLLRSMSLLDVSSSKLPCIENTRTNIYLAAISIDVIWTSVECQQGFSRESRISSVHEENRRLFSELLRTNTVGKEQEWWIIITCQSLSLKMLWNGSLTFPSTFLNSVPLFNT